MLVKERTWSATQFQLYQRCKAAYVYQYNKSWKAWREEDEEALASYLNKKTFTSTQLYNECFSEGLDTLVHDFLQFNVQTQRAKLAQFIFNKLRSQIPLEGHWEVIQEYAWAICDDIYKIYNDETFQELLEKAVGQVLFLNRRDYFWLDTIKVWGLANLAYYSDHEELTLVQWDLLSGNKVSLQRKAFAAVYAMKKYRTAHEDIRICELSLTGNGGLEQKCSHLSMKSILEYQDLILNSSIKMEGLRRKDLESLEDFKCNKKATCDGCRFQSVCDGELY